FLITFFSIVFIALLFSIGVSYFVIESIFRLSWSLEIINSAIILLLIGFLTIALILFNNYRFLSPKVYPLVRNE
nr:hypothetical protein [Candidatus Fonsibacter sp.]